MQSSLTLFLKAQHPFIIIVCKHISIHLFINFDLFQSFTRLQQSIKRVLLVLPETFKGITCIKSDKKQLSLHTLIELH